MTNGQIEVITSVQRRRRWTEAEKAGMVASSLEPGAVVSAIAREAGIHPSQLYGWRRQLCGSPRAAPAFAAVSVATEQASATPALPMAPGVIDIEFASGVRVRVAGAVDPGTISAVVLALAQGGRRR